jgi:hypothetical protein
MYPDSMVLAGHLQVAMGLGQLEKAEYQQN